MRVLVMGSLYPKHYHPGTGIFVYRQIRALQAAGVEVTGVVSPVPWSPRPLWTHPRWRAYGLEPYGRIDPGGIQVLQPRVVELPRRLGFPMYGLLYRYAQGSAVRELHQQGPFDLIHAHVAHPDGTAALAIGRHYGVPVVITVHGQDLQVSIHRNTATRRAVVQALRTADHVVLVSEKLRSIATAEGISGRFSVVPNAIDPNMPVDATLSERLHALRSQAGRVVLSVGNLIPSKGQEWVMRSLRPGDHYWLVGDGPERARLEHLAAHLGVADRVRFWGQVEPDKVSAFMQAADVFALPSAPEAFGMVYLEAMLAGIPVVACAGEGDPHLLEDGVTALLVPPRDPQAVAAAFAQLVHNPAIATRLTDAAARRVMSTYTLAAQASRLRTVYEQVCEGRSTAGKRQTGGQSRAEDLHDHDRPPGT